MRRASIPAIAVLLVTLGILAIGSVPRPAFASHDATTEVAWADAVVSFKAGAGDVAANFDDPMSSLGPVDAGIVALGNAQTPSAPPANPTACEAVLIVSFGRYQIVDGEGDDLTIYESAGGGVSEPIWVYLGGEDTGWRFVGESAGGKDSLDIGHVADPSDSFSQVALCDVPDGNTTSWPAPGPDIDAIAAENSARIGLVAQAQGPGWSVDLDPVRSAAVFTPLVEFQDLGFAPPAVFRFQCPLGEAVSECNSYLVVKANCGGDLSLTPPLWYIYPFLNPTLGDLGAPVTLRELRGGYVEERFEEVYAFCFNAPGRAAAADPEPITVFTLDEGGAGYQIVEEAWRFELRLPTAGVYSEGANHFLAAHDPAGGRSLVRVISGSLSVDPTVAGEAPFPLSAGQQVILTAGGPGPVVDLDLFYLPAALR